MLYPHEDHALAKKTREAKQDDKAREKDLNAVFRALGETAPGRTFLWWLLEIGKIGQQPFALDPHVTAFNCGELNVGQQISAQFQHADPKGYLELLKENQSERPKSKSKPNPNSESDADTSADSDA